MSLWYCFTERLDPAALAAAEASLSPDEVARADRFRFAHDRRDYVAAHGMLRAALSARFGGAPGAWVFAGRPDEKPTLVSPGGIDFSLAHTRGLVACAVTAEGRIGVDAENAERRLSVDGIARRFFAPDEASALDRLCGAERLTRFIELWTLKEAYVKALGTGIARGPIDFAFDLGDPATIGFTRSPAGAGPGEWQFVLLAPAPGYRIALAVVAPRPLDCRVRDWLVSAEPTIAIRRSA